MINILLDLLLAYLFKQILINYYVFYSTRIQHSTRPNQIYLSDKIFYFKKTNQSFLQIKPLFRFILETPNIFDDSKIDVLKVEINEIIN